MPILVTDDAPCSLDATLWRECLKTFDYGPDKPQSACEKQRHSYYQCIKQWRSSKAEAPGSAAAPYKSSDFYTTPKCARQAEKLHVCMMTGMFEMANCREPMLELKACGYRNDPQVRQALADDDELLQYMSKMQQEDSTVKQWWNKVMGKA